LHQLELAFLDRCRQTGEQAVRCKCHGRYHDNDRDDHAVVLGSSSVDSSGHARFATSRLGQGDHFIVALYLGDDNLHSSRSAVLKQVVEKGK